MRNFQEFSLYEVHNGAKVCIAPSRSVKTAGQGTRMSPGIMRKVRELGRGRA
jgi:hypothetical protein